MPAARITGQVAAILNEREVVMNVGHEAGVSEGMKFKVMDQPKAVKDPSTGEEIGTVSREKLRVKVVQVQPRIAIARTYETYEKNLGGIGPGFGMLAGFSKFFEPPKIVTRVRTLRYEDSGLDYGPIDEAQSFVKVGDPVELVEEETATES